MIPLFPSIHQVKYLLQKSNEREEFFYAGFPLIFVEYFWEQRSLVVEIEVNPRYGNYIGRVLTYISKTGPMLKWELSDSYFFLKFKSRENITPKRFLKEYREIRDSLLFLKNGKPRDKKVRVTVISVALAYAVKLSHVIMLGNTVYLLYPGGYVFVESMGDFRVLVNDVIAVAKAFENIVRSVSNVDASSEELVGYVWEAVERDKLLKYLKRFVNISDDGLKPRLDVNFVYDVFSTMISPKFMVYLQRTDQSGDTSAHVRELMNLSAPYSLVMNYVLDKGPPLYFIILGYRNPHITRYIEEKNTPLAPFHDIVAEINMKKEKGSKSFLKNWIENIYIPFMNGLSFYTLPFVEE